MTTIALNSSETIASAPALRDALLQALVAESQIGIDASATSVIDTAAMQTLAAFWQTLAGRGQTAELLEPSVEFRRAAKALGLDRLFGV